MDNEEVAYGLYSPDVFDPQTGKLTAQAIQLEHLLGRNGKHVDNCGYSSGVSVCRLSEQAALDQLWQILEVFTVKRSDRQTEGYAIASVQKICAINGPKDKTPSLDIFDDGRLDYPSHAVIRGTPGSSRGALRGPRDELVALFNTRVVRQIID
jgi:hypothetical protein